MSSSHHWPLAQLKKKNIKTKMEKWKNSSEEAFLYHLVSNTLEYRLVSSSFKDIF